MEERRQTQGDGDDDELRTAQHRQTRARREGPASGAAEPCSAQAAGGASDVRDAAAAGALGA
jgi:hypothetical protein